MSEEQNVDRNRSHESSSSSESSESIDFDPERQPLIRNADSKALNYKSTTGHGGVDVDEDEIGDLEEEPSSKSVLAIISLLLIGISRSEH